MMSEFIPPVNFDLVLKHKRPEPLKAVINYLLQKDSNMSHPFQWEMVMLESSDIYQLSIQSSWASNLKEIASILERWKERK